MLPRLDQISALRSLIRHSHAAREEIVFFQNRKLRRLIAHAYNNVPYYKRLFDENGIRPGDVQTAEDLSAIPVTSKKDLQVLPPEDVIARGVDNKKLIVRRTSGATGEPSIIRRTWFEERLLGAFRMRTFRYFGLKMRDRFACIGLVLPTDRHDYQIPLRILQTLGLYRRASIDCRLDPEEILKFLRHYNPDVLISLPGVLSQIAQYIGNADRLMVRPRFIIAAAEVLTPQMRHQIARLFSAPVFNLYASHEFSLIAGECRDTGELHTCDDSVIVEVVKNGRTAATGERGEVVGTNLHSFAMPFIRYRLGDMATRGSEICRCGQPFSTIKEIQGRMIDYFPLPGGRVIHPYDIVSKFMLDDTSWLSQYQLVQESENQVILRLVTYTAPPPQRITQIEESVNRLLGQDVKFRAERVPEIKPEPNGKFRVSRSLVNSDYEGKIWD